MEGETEDVVAGAKVRWNIGGAAFGDLRKLATLGQCAVEIKELFQSGRIFDPVAAKILAAAGVRMALKPTWARSGNAAVRQAFLKGSAVALPCRHFADGRLPGALHCRIPVSRRSSRFAANIGQDGSGVGPQPRDCGWINREGQR